MTKLDVLGRKKLKATHRLSGRLGDSVSDRVQVAAVVALLLLLDPEEHEVGGGGPAGLVLGLRGGPRRQRRRT